MSKRAKNAPMDALAAVLPERSAKAGEVLVREGSYSDSLMILVEGMAEVRLQVAKGALIVGQKGPGAWVGEMGLLTPGPASASVVATEATRVRVLSHASYLDLLETQPRAVGEALHTISEDIVARLRSAREQPESEGEDQAVSMIRALVGAVTPDLARTTSPRRAAEKQMPRVDEEALMATLEHAGVFPQADARTPGLRKALAALAGSGLSVQTYLHGETIFSEGDRADGAFVMLGGHAVLEARADRPFAPGGRLGPGDLFGHHAFFADRVRAATVRSEGASVVAVLWPGTVDEILRQARSGTTLWLPLLDWFSQRLASEAREFNHLLVKALLA